MTAERPSAGVLAGITALAFIVAFAAAAVLRPQAAAPAPAANVTLATPTPWRTERPVAGAGVRGLSPVASLPGLRLPVSRKPKRHHSAVRAAATPVATPRPVVTAAPAETAASVATAAPPVSTATAAPPVSTAPAKPRTPNVGQTFDSSG